MKNSMAVLKVLFISAWVVLFFIELTPKADLTVTSTDSRTSSYFSADLPLTIEYTLTYKIHIDNCLFKCLIFFIIFLLSLRLANRPSTSRHFVPYCFQNHLIFSGKKILFLPRDRIP
jgi:hypothetical protein